MREFEEGLEPKCAFCREPVPATKEEIDKNERKRVKANDPIALFQMGQKCENEGNFEGAIQYYTKAAELGDISSHYNLSVIYLEGEGVEKDEKKSIYHSEEAAIEGHPKARFNLGCTEGNNGMNERAAKHFIISANLGFDRALEALKEGFAKGLVGKDDYAAALRGHQAAVDATKSEQREEAEKARQLYYRQRNQN
jgi:TPR repeat protein